VFFSTAAAERDLQRAAAFTDPDAEELSDRIDWPS
jgi:hypothetical protein